MTYLARRLPACPVLLGAGAYGIEDREQIERRGRVRYDQQGRPCLAYKGRLVPVIAGGSLGQFLPARIPESAGTIFYVSTSGSDSNPGSSISPWRTIQHAVATLGNNQKARVMSGTYTENLSISATHTQTATIEADTGATVTLAGSILTNGNAAYWRLRNFTVQGGGSADRLLTTFWDNAAHIEFYGLTIKNATESGGLAQGTYVDGSGIADIQIWNTVYSHNGSSNLDHGIYVHTTPAGGGVPALLLGNCVFSDNAGFGIHFYPTCNNALAVNCTAAYQGQSGYVISQNGSNGSNGNRIANSIAYRNDADGSNRNGPSGFDVQYMTTGASPVNHIDSIVGYLNGGANTGYNNPNSNPGVTVGTKIEADPLFLSPGTRDFHLLAGSPAVGVAIPEYCPSFDFSGAARV